MDTTRTQILSLVRKHMKYYLLETPPDTKHSLPLVESTYDGTEVAAMVDVLLGEKLTMGRHVAEFEAAFAQHVGSAYAVMVNSGSSANLLGMAVLSNHKRTNRLRKGDRVLVPVVCWSTSVWPIIQMGLEPVFVDINPCTLNIDVNAVEALLRDDPTIRGMVCVHVLGNCPDMEHLMSLKEKYNMVILEDTCESLGSTYRGKHLGTFGECGTFSFYFSHHITTVEGGMVVTDDYNTYELLKCMRAHGWTRNIDARPYESVMKERNVSEQFCFVNMGYNLRPMEIQGAMGKVQLGRLEGMNSIRIQNYKLLRDAFESHVVLSKRVCLFDVQEGCTCAWFAFPLLLLDGSLATMEVTKRLNEAGIDTRPVITGNFLKQPIFSELDLCTDADPEHFPNANLVHDRGFFVGLSCYPFTQEKIAYIVGAFVDATEPPS